MNPNISVVPICREHVFYIFMIVEIVFLIHKLMWKRSPRHQRNHHWKKPNHNFLEKVENVGYFVTFINPGLFLAEKRGHGQCCRKDVLSLTKKKIQ